MTQPEQVPLNEPAALGRRGCHFCKAWSYSPSGIDTWGDVIDAYDKHIQRHAEAATVADFEAAIFRDLTRGLG